MKITDDGVKAIIELETPEGMQAFRQGIQDRRHWFQTPETTEMAQYIGSNVKCSQLVVKVGDSYQRIK